MVMLVFKGVCLFLGSWMANPFFEASISCSLAIACGLGFGITGWSGGQHLFFLFFGGGGRFKAKDRLIVDLASRLVFSWITCFECIICLMFVKFPATCTESPCIIMSEKALAEDLRLPLPKEDWSKIHIGIAFRNWSMADPHGLSIGLFWMLRIWWWS